MPWSIESDSPPVVASLRQRLNLGPSQRGSFVMRDGGWWWTPGLVTQIVVTNRRSRARPGGSAVELAAPCSSRCVRDGA